MRGTSLFLATVVALAACGGSSSGGGSSSRCSTTVAPSNDDYATIQQALIDARPGDRVCLAAGSYSISSELSISTRDVTLRGAEAGDREAAVLDFAAQTTGASGIHATGDDFTVENLWLKNTRGEGIRITGANNVTFRGLKISWDAGSSFDNGAYGTFPVQCTNVLIEDNIISGAWDAAIYVGQSNTIIVRNNQLSGNVNGINIENSRNVDVYGNRSIGNTGGIAIFNLPNLPVQNGGRVRVFDNVFDDNNHVNFGDPNAIIGIVPSGTGLIVLAADDVEIFDNSFQGNRSAGIIIASYTAVPFPSDDENHNPWVQDIFIHDNTFGGNGGDPQGIVTLLGHDTLEDILWGGDIDPALDGQQGAPFICIRDNGDASYRQGDVQGGFANQDTDLSRHDCALEPLPEISVSVAS